MRSKSKKGCEGNQTTNTALQTFAKRAEKKQRNRKKLRCVKHSMCTAMTGNLVARRLVWLLLKN